MAYVAPSAQGGSPGCKWAWLYVQHEKSSWEHGNADSLPTSLITLLAHFMPQYSIIALLLTLVYVGYPPFEHHAGSLLRQRANEACRRQNLSPVHMFMRHRTPEEG